MRNILFRGRVGRQLFAKYEKLPMLAARTTSRVDARTARTAGIAVTCVYLTFLLLSAYAIA